jgi:thiosulfate dehydrogenase (quinone) large subunit
MGSTTIEGPDSVAPELPTQASAAPVVEAERPIERPRDREHAILESSKGTTLRFPAWLYRSHGASLLWLVVRLWLGYQWVNAGYQKIWGSERSAFWFGNGLGVKGFATAGVAGSTAGKGGASYGWFAGFLHNFVIPNASWIGKFISLAEILIGVALILGLLTGAAALAGLSLNIIYMFAGSAGVNPAFAILSVLLVLAWRNAGWIGLDRFILGDRWVSHRSSDATGHLTRRGVAPVAT